MAETPMVKIKNTTSTLVRVNLSDYDKKTGQPTVNRFVEFPPKDVELTGKDGVSLDYGPGVAPIPLEVWNKLCKDDVRIQRRVKAHELLELAN